MPDLLQGGSRSLLIDWDNTTISDRASMYARHWIIMSHEHSWQYCFLKELETRNEQPEFWQRFIVHVAYRGLDQCHYEMERREGLFKTVDDLMVSMPARAGIVMRMVNALNKIYKLTIQT